MKSNKIYFVKFTKTVDIDTTEEHPIYQELSQVIDEEEKSYLGFTDSEDVFIRLVDYKVKKILSIFKKHGFEFTVEDYSKKVSLGIAQKEYPEVEILTPQIFQDYRIEFTSVDDVLDKILESGIDSLDETDKLILKK